MSYAVSKDYIKKYLQSDKGRYAQFKAAAKARNLLVTLTYEQYTKLRQNPCEYCNGKLPATGGLDRVDCTRMYSLDNVVPCCGECNRIKSNKYTKEQMKAIAAVLQLFRV